MIETNHVFDVFLSCNLASVPNVKELLLTPIIISQ